ncbi:MAG TPA: radical SAM family RiPP maturation amino acid epimerase [Coleofasciculaceae cyanobacterium]|jgi:radical SAM family RiPP maturation amino acid epimerase
MNKQTQEVEKNTLVEKANSKSQDDKFLKLGWKDNFELVKEKELLSVSHLKRFFERWHGDANFRKQLSANSYETIFRYGLKIDPDKIRPLWDEKYENSCLKEELFNKIPNFDSLEHYQSLTEKIRPELMKSVASSSTNMQFKLWRQRQINRTASQMKQQFHNALVHAPICFELSKGCSVGCWFCGVAAPRLSDIFFHTQENARLWQEVLVVMKEILGAAAGAGFCYWASDPLDNPDYEKFCLDFYEVLGGFPQTTTSQPMKDPDRVRALLKLSKEKGCVLNRFSILSLKTLNQVHEEFSAEELALVKLVLLHEEANMPKALSGKARERWLKKKDKDNKSYSPSQGTIACVTGFLFNMVDKSVKLISPCNASNRWPLGYIVYEEGTFTDASDLRLLLERMIDTNMSFNVEESSLIRFRRDLQFDSLADGFQLSNSIKTFKFKGDLYLKELGKIISKADKTAAEISYLFEMRGISSGHTLHNLNLMFNKGVLDSEPDLEHTAILN